VAEGAHDMGREHAVLARLHEAYPLAPEAFLYCGDPSVVGTEFFVMERRTGVVVREKLPDAYDDVADAPQRMSHALIDGLADLHAVDYDEIGLGKLGDPGGFIARQIDGWMKRWRAARTDDMNADAAAAMGEAHAWLESHQPPAPAGGGTLVHNDYKLDNLMLAPEDPGHAVAVFDWDMCTLGDPLSDLGALLTYWAQPSDPAPFRAIAQMPVDERFPTREALVRRYAEASGRDLGALQEQLPFYHALGLFRLTVIIAQIYVRYQRGQTADERFATLGQMVPVTARAAVDVAQGQFA
jgi:aminoglycoside phosphotransferase (APT) family kinase protein